MLSINPLVTVLMPVYNAERHLREAIESILGQTLKDFEFLIIDDGSSDASTDIVRSYDDPRIRFVLNEKNLGITATLNKGIQLASSELIARMDADDISRPDRLLKQYHFFQQHPDCVLLSSAVRHIYSNNKRPRDVHFKNETVYYELIFNTRIYHPTVMYRRSVLLREGGYQTRYAEDFNLWWRLSRKYEFFHDDQILLDYRYTDSSLWKVTKRDEYDLAEYEQIVSNINSYSNGRLSFTYDEVDFLRKDLRQLVREKGLGFIRDCFRKLDSLNQQILEKEKGGKWYESIKMGSMEKRRERISNLRRFVPARRFIPLLIQLGYLDLLVDELKRPITKRLKFYNL